MNKYIRLYALLIPAALWGCSGNGNTPVVEDAKMCIRSCVARTPSGEETNVLDMGLFAFKADGSIFNGANNLHATFESDKWNLSGITLTDENVNVFAYSPYASQVNGKELHISSPEQIDWLVSEGTPAIKSANKLDIVMNHLLTKVMFTLKGTKVSQVKLGSYRGEAYYNLITKGMSVSEKTSMITCSGNSIMLLPENPATGKTFILTIGEKEYSYTFYPDKLESGKRYDCSLEIKGNDIQIVGVTLNDWSAGGEYSGVIHENQ